MFFGYYFIVTITILNRIDLGAVVDAVGLYARYISLDADQPLGLPSSIRNHIEGISQFPILSL